MYNFVLHVYIKVFSYIFLCQAHCSWDPLIPCHLSFWAPRRISADPPRDSSRRSEWQPGHQLPYLHASERSGYQHCSPCSGLLTSRQKQGYRGRQSLASRLFYSDEYITSRLSRVKTPNLALFASMQSRTFSMIHYYSFKDHILEYYWRSQAAHYPRYPHAYSILNMALLSLPSDFCDCTTSILLFHCM